MAHQYDERSAAYAPHSSSSTHRGPDDVYPSSSYPPPLSHPSPPPPPPPSSSSSEYGYVPPHVSGAAPSSSSYYDPYYGSSSYGPSYGSYRDREPPRSYPYPPSGDYRGGYGAEGGGRGEGGYGGYYERDMGYGRGYDGAEGGYDRERPYGRQYYSGGPPPSRYEGWGAGGRGGRGGGPRRGMKERPPPAAPSPVLGVFGLHTMTTEAQLKALFSEYGPVDKVMLIKDKWTGGSKGFGFVYFERLEDSKRAKEAMAGREIDGRTVRCDFSVTPAAHPSRFAAANAGPAATNGAGTAAAAPSAASASSSSASSTAPSDQTSGGTEEKSSSSSSSSHPSSTSPDDGNQQHEKEGEGEEGSLAHYQI